jgi:hypothetical protein
MMTQINIQKTGKVRQPGLASVDKVAAAASNLIPYGATVLDLGSGVIPLSKHLPSCSIYCFPLPSRGDPEAALSGAIERNSAFENATHIAILRGLENFDDPEAVLRRLRVRAVPLIVSCAILESGHQQAPRRRGAAPLARERFLGMVKNAGFHVRTEMRVKSGESVFRLDPGACGGTASPRVLVLSCANWSNFGDRLGYHLIQEVLPPETLITHFLFPPWTPPEGEFDLMILGLGVSVFQPMLDAELYRLMDRMPRVVGIFGTQYRPAIPPRSLDALLDRLSVWYARYEEDILLYGNNRNVAHLGDWLLHAFPFTRGERQETLRVGSEVLKRELPLDRTIQKIQSYRRVFSTRLHPLLCALASAEEVAYREQREDGSGNVSGKFRSMLLDVFGRCYPENKFFAVDREAVLNYKINVARNVEGLRQSLARMLSPQEQQRPQHNLNVQKVA